MSTETAAVVGRILGTLPATWLVFWLLERKALRAVPTPARQLFAFAGTVAVATVVGGYGAAPTGSHAPLLLYAFGEYLPACLLWLGVSLYRARKARRASTSRST